MSTKRGGLRNTDVGNETGSTKEEHASTRDRAEVDFRSLHAGGVNCRFESGGGFELPRDRPVTCGRLFERDLFSARLSASARFAVFRRDPVQRGDQAGS